MTNLGLVATGVALALCALLLVLATRSDGFLLFGLVVIATGVGMGFRGIGGAIDEIGSESPQPRPRVRRGPDSDLRARHRRSTTEARRQRPDARRGARRRPRGAER